MSAFTRIGAAQAAGVLAEAKAIGVTITISHRGAVAVTLYALIAKNEIGKVEDAGAVIETRVLQLIVPVQTGFATPSGEAEPVTPGDVVSYLSREYLVTDPVDADAEQCVYRLRCIEAKALNAGVA